MKPTSKKIYILCGLNMINSILIILEAFITKEVIDKALYKEEIFNYILTLIIVVVFQIILRLIYKHLKNTEDIKIETVTKQALFNSLLEKKVSCFDNYHTGELSNLYLVDIRNIASGKTETIPGIFADISKATFSFIALAIMDFKFLCILIVVGLLLFLVASIFYPKIKSLQQESLEHDGKVNAYMQETIENVKVVKALGATKNAKYKLVQKVEKTKKVKIKKNHIMEVAENGLSIAMNLSYLFAILYSIYNIVHNKMSYGDLFVFVQLVMVFEGPLMSFAGYLNKINVYRTSKTRINSLFNLEDEDSTPIIQDFDEIIFDDVTFQYDEKTVINHFSETIKKDELILFKGPSGAGKTTLFFLMLGFYQPNSGHIFIKYKDVKYEASAKTRSLFSYVSQRNILFSGRLFENIRFFNPDVTDEEIINVLDQVKLKDELSKRESTLDIMLHEHGEGMSVGQIQRVLIAISLLQNKPCMLLDEFSSSLDEENEKSIVELLLKLNKTIVFISHRPLTNQRIRRIEI